MPVWVTTSLPPVNFSAMRHSSSAPSGLKMAVSPSIVAMPLPSPLVRAWTLWRFVFVNARKFDLKMLLTQRPDFELAVFRFPGTIHLSGCNTLVAIADTVTTEAAAKHSAQSFHVFCMMLLRGIEIHRHPLVKQKASISCGIAQAASVPDTAKCVSSKCCAHVTRQPSTRAYGLRPLTPLEATSVRVVDWQSSLFLAVSLPRPGEEELPA